MKAFAEQVRLTLTLSDTLNGRQIWTERFDRVISDVALFELQDELVGLVASKIASSYGALSLNEYQNIKHKALSSLNSYEARLVYLDYLVKMSPANLERTIGMFEHLNQTLPDGEARGLAILAQLYCDQYLLGQAELEGALERSKQCIAKAMDIDPQNVEVLLAQAWWALLSGDDRLVKVSTEAILELNPSSSYTLSAASWLCYLSGHFEFSVSVLQQSLIKLPVSPNWLKLVFAMDTVRQGNIEPLSEFLVATQFEDNFVQLIFVALIYQWAGEERLAKKHWHMASKLHVETRQTAERLINHVIISDELSRHFNDALQALLTQ
ncbi:hypothetical protein JCM19240_4223 [Vibrio maritimus]|uniref:Adenylate cyclase n=1 Tax=Vibrio maritimus TaxID=990268 RepID=A0A090T629_9VIBR|nr:hypothetical protein JCM19240_4223 [Vibrio maritimus]